MNVDPPSDRPRLAGEAARPRSLLMRYLSRFDDGEVIRWAFRGLLIGAVGVLSIDLYDLWRANQMAEARLAPPIEASPVLPPAVEGGTQPNSSDPRPYLTTEGDVLRQPIRFTLESGGVLKATGSIEAGAADRFAVEIAARGEYVKTVALDSPGGALEDAMAMARLIRERGLSTEVPDGALCASSCPLVLAGGTHRRAGEKAAVGVHQFYAAGTEEVPAAQVMADAQSTTARITRHLSSMDVDPALWLHALDTPPRALYYFSHDELARFRLVTPD